MSVSTTCYGGINVIGGNKLLLEDGNTLLFFDFGIAFGRQQEYFNCSREQIAAWPAGQQCQRITEPLQPWPLGRFPVAGRQSGDGGCSGNMNVCAFRPQAVTWGLRNCLHETHAPVSAAERWNRGGTPGVYEVNGTGH